MSLPIGLTVVGTYLRAQTEALAMQVHLNVSPIPAMDINIPLGSLIIDISYVNHIPKGS